MRKSLRTRSMMGVAAVALAPAALMMSAAVAPAAAQDGADDDTIVVTGSRIARKDLVSGSPVAVIGQDALELTGFNQVATVLNELPQAGVPGSVDTSTNFRTATTGINTIDLRNLGTNRTLVLVNGRRHVGGSAGSPTVDVSMIPAPLVQRVEVATGGASAVYGSEAVAGVINFIMRDDFEGVELYGRAGGSEDGGANDKDISVMAGSSFADGRGNAVIYAGYSDRGILRSTDRARSAADATNSSYGPKGRFWVSPSLGSANFTQDDTTGLWDKAFNSAEDGFNRNGSRLIRVPTERTQVNANLSYDINDYVTFFSETAYSQLFSKAQTEPSIVGQQISVGSIPNITIPVDNPFIPAELLAEIIANDPTTTEIAFFRRFTEVGPRTSDVQRQTFRTAIGLEGELPGSWGGWGYEAYLQYGSNSQDQTNGGVYNTLNVLNALNVESDGMGGFQCKDSLARDLGCVPINFFGAGTVTGAALDFVSVDNQVTTRMEQTVIGLSFTGDLFELPAGPVGSAFGFEYREESSAFNSDALAQSGLTSGNTTPNTKGRYDVYEGFAEVRIPVLADVPLAESLFLEGAVRYADYSTIGGAVAWRAGAVWNPFADLTLRGGYSTAVRAPNIGELFDPGSETFRSFNDPCALGGVGGPSANPMVMQPYATQSATVQANCATIPGTATLDPAFLNIQSAGGLAAGNVNLNEETSKTYTVGMVYSPSSLPGFNLVVDYYNITIDDAINSFSAQTTVDQCVRQPSFPTNPFCDLIQRDPVTGLVERIDALAINVASFKAAGIDFAADYSFDAGEAGVRLQVNGNHSMANDFLPFAGGNVVDSQGEIGVPDWKVNGSAVVDWNRLRVGWSTRFISGVNVENDDATFGTIPSFFYHDLYAQYQLDDDGNYEFFFGVDNLFDKQPPILGQGVPGDVTGTNTAADIYDAIGRTFYGGFRLTF